MVNVTLFTTQDVVILDLFQYFDDKKTLNLQWVSEKPFSFSFSPTYDRTLKANEKCSEGFTNIGNINKSTRYIIIAPSETSFEIYFNITEQLTTSVWLIFFLVFGGVFLSLILYIHAAFANAIFFNIKKNSCK